MYVCTCMCVLMQLKLSFFLNTSLWSTGRFHSAWVTSSFASLHTQPGKQSADQRLPFGKNTVYLEYNHVLKVSRVAVVIRECV